MKTDNTCLERGSAVRKALDNRIRYFLHALESSDVCSQAERQCLYKIVFAVELSLKEAYDNLREIRRDLGPVDYQLQIHPAWLCGLLNIVDALIDRVAGEDSVAYQKVLDALDADLNLLIKATHRYRLIKQVFV